MKNKSKSQPITLYRLNRTCLQKGDAGSRNAVISLPNPALSPDPLKTENCWKSRRRRNT